MGKGNYGVRIKPGMETSLIVLFLGQKSEPATPMDGQVIEDLLDTLKAHEDGCVGMAANMRE
jgi:peptide deformylase